MLTPGRIEVRASTGSDLLKFKIRVTVHNPQSIIYTSKLINNPQFTIYFLIGCWFLSFFRFTIQNPQFIVWFAQTNSIIHIALFSESQIDLTFSKFLIYMFHIFFSLHETTFWLPLLPTHSDLFDLWQKRLKLPEIDFPNQSFLLSCHLFDPRFSPISLIAQQRHSKCFPHKSRRPQNPYFTHQIYYHPQIT